MTIMDTYRGFYEYPSSQAAILVLPSKNGGSVTPAKVKRNWGDLLKIPGLSKKEKDPASFQHGAIYSPQFQLPQAYGYISPKSPAHNTQIITTTPYRDPSRYNLPSTKGRHTSYNATCGRASGSTIRAIVNPAQANSKNAVKYTDWFGSVVSRKPPARASIPAFYSGSPAQGDKGISPGSPWDKYSTSVSPQVPVEGMALVPLQSYNICVCPEQLYATRSKKKKKCKQCGKKYGTVKNATAIGSAVRLRPAIPPSFYKVPTNSPWPWPHGPTVLYSQPMHGPVRPIQNQSYLREAEESEDSPPQTPETVRTVRSGNSSKSNDSNSTITQDSFFPPRSIPPPPSVPLPSIPLPSRDRASSSLMASVSTSSRKPDKTPSIIRSVKTAYELIDTNKGSVSGSDTDELSDNAVYTGWENVESLTKGHQKVRQPVELNGHNNSRVSVIPIGGDTTSAPQAAKNGYTSSVTPTKSDSNTVRIINTSNSKVVIENKFEKNSKFKPNYSNSSRHLALKESQIDDDSFWYSRTNGYQKEKLKNRFQDGNKSPPPSRKRSSHTSKKKRNNIIIEEDTSSCYPSSNESDPAEDRSKVISIAGRRVLLDQNQGNKSFLSPTHLAPKGTIHPLANGHSAVLEITDWESLQDYVNNSAFDNRKEGNDIDELMFNGSKNSAYQKASSATKNSYCITNGDSKPNPISSDIRDIIQEEEVGDQLIREVTRKEPNNGEEIEMEESQNDEPPEIWKIIQNGDKPEHILTTNGYLEDRKPPSSPSLPDSSSRTNGFQPTLSELLQVKSILKRPNSLDTSSETDSDFYLPTISEFKQNTRKKKSVQFRQSDEVNLVEGTGESKGRKVSSLKAARRDRIRRKGREVKNLTSEEDAQEIHDSSSLKTNEVNPSFQSELSTKYDINWDAIEETDISRNGDLSGEQEFPSDYQCTDVTVNTPIESDQQSTALSDNSNSLGRSLDNSQTPNENLPIFGDSNPTKPIRPRRPTRKAPPPPRNSPLRPTVPPPPPPSSASTLPDLEEPRYNGDAQTGEEACDNEVASSLSSISISPSPSPPPPLPSSSPPPLPSSSPPPLEDEDKPFESPGVSFSSFIDPRSPVVSISTKAPQAQPSVAAEVPIQDLKETLSSSIHSSPSVFEARENSSMNIATIKGRVKATKLSLPLNQDTSSSSSYTFKPTKPANSLSAKRQVRTYNLNPSHKLSFLGNRTEEVDVEECLSDHIYEELPSFSSSPSGSLPNFQEKSIFDGASKYEILEFLQDARSRVDMTAVDEEDMNLINPLAGELSTLALEDEEDQTGAHSPADDPLLPSRYVDGRSSNRSSNSESSENSGLLRSDKERLAAGDIERTDSGVGSETSKPLVSLRRCAKGSAATSPNLGCHIGLREGDLPPCDDCETPVEARVTNSGFMYAPLVCRRCSRRRQERKEILTEIIETEVKYGRDLKVMMEQFCRPMRVAGLLSRDQLNRIFLNIDDLIDHNRQFSIQLRDAYEIALDQGDEDLLTVNVAKLFLHASPMLHAFQNYCVRQGAASILLQNLEKEKELLRIFLKVSQMENTLLRRMNLHSFLMVPVQRVTKYPLLLARLFKTTPPSHPSREDCRRAREKIELYLQHINNETKEANPTKLWRRISMSVGNNTPTKWVSQPLEYDTSLKLRTVVLDILEWSNDEAVIVREGRLLCLPPESTNWTKRGRAIKMATVQMVLVTFGRPKFTLEEKVPEDGLITPCDIGIKEAAVLAFKDHRLSKAALIRDPWYLSRTVLTWDAEGETECFELTDLATRETFIFKDRECVGTEEWFRAVQFHALSVGGWRRRRPALANIMINGASRS